MLLYCPSATLEPIALDGPDLPVWVSGRTDAVEDALRNLIENAVVYSPPQTEVTVTVLPEGAVGISDPGPGIPEQDRPHIFERFWRGRAAEQGRGWDLPSLPRLPRRMGARLKSRKRPAAAPRSRFA